MGADGRQASLRHSDVLTEDILTEDEFLRVKDIAYYNDMDMFNSLRVLGYELRDCVIERQEHTGTGAGTGAGTEAGTGAGTEAGACPGSKLTSPGSLRVIPHSPHGWTHEDQGTHLFELRRAIGFDESMPSVPLPPDLLVEGCATMQEDHREILNETPI